MKKRYTRGIWWIKRDFRLADNEALCRAIEDCEAVLPVFIIEPSLCSAAETSFFHYHAWQQAGMALNDALQLRGSALHLCVGEVCDVLEALRSIDGFDALYSHEETGSAITYARDKKVGQWARQHNIPWQESCQNGVIRGLSDRDQRSPIIQERLLDTAGKPAPVHIHTWHSRVNSGAVQAVTQWPEFHRVCDKAVDQSIRHAALQAVSENDAHEDLQSFLDSRGIRYAGGISSPNTAFEAGSRLSVHLAWGTISLRTVFRSLIDRDRQLAPLRDSESQRWRKSLRAFQSRLHWHDHFMQRLESFPSMEFETINPAYRKLRYADNPVLLSAWETGNTGLPMVDACVRCLRATGFLNFRMRAMLVSTGCFGMAQSWRALQYPLARLFRDYEPGIHLSQIQMQAGVVGINTLRIYSPHKQLIDQDPQARFVKRWIPELREFEAVEIARYDEQTLGDYPPPITDFKANTQVIRDRVYAIRKSSAGKEAAELVLQAHGSRLPGNDRARALKGRSGGRRKSAKASGNSTQLRLDFDG